MILDEEEMDQDDLNDGDDDNEDENEQSNDNVDDDFGLERVDEDDDNDSLPDEQLEKEEDADEHVDESFISFALQRQTLLFTATGLETAKNQKVLQKSYLTAKQAKKLKLKGTVKGLANDCSLPTAIKE